MHHRIPDHARRVRVQNDLSVPGHPEIFVIGDTASLDQNGKPLPGVAQVAMQQGRYVGMLIRRRLADKPAPPAFHYRDKGSLVVVGKGFAILQTGPIKLSDGISRLAPHCAPLRGCASVSSSERAIGTDCFASPDKTTMSHGDLQSLR